MSEAGAVSPFEHQLVRTNINASPGTTGAGVSFTPLEHLDGIITPSRLHFERHHSGIPTINPDKHQLFIQGLVRKPLVFTSAVLARYPMVSNIHFLECSGNSFRANSKSAKHLSCGSVHGLISGSEWTGVPLKMLLDEAGIQAEAKWLVASGADAGAMNRSVPLSKILDDAIVALYQNGEPLRPANGYPMRLFLPGWEGNMSIKWLQNIVLTREPAMTREETSKYSDLQADGTAKLFTFPMGVKSVITSPSPGLLLNKDGVYQIKGIAWTGSGKIRRVEVSADGGKSWADAQLDSHVLPKALTRFRAAWKWQGNKAVLLSRATDEFGAVQPTKTVALSGNSPGNFYHFNGIQPWRVHTDGSVSNGFV